LRRRFFEEAMDRDAALCPVSNALRDEGLGER
jgi:hypothetical protein